MLHSFTTDVFPFCQQLFLNILIIKNNRVAKYFPVVYELVVTTSKNKLVSTTNFKFFGIYLIHFIFVYSYI